MYQHDVNQNKLNEKLVNVIEDVVNRVGVDLDYSILSYIFGLSLSLGKKDCKV